MAISTLGEHGASDPALRGVLAGAQDAFYAQLMLDPLEEQFAFQRLMCGVTTVEAGGLVLLVRKTAVVSDLGSTYRIPRRWCR